MSFAEFISACEQAEDIHISHVILTGREKRLGEYRQEPYPENGLRLLFSMTKSFASLAVGIAWDRGLLGLDDRITDWFREELPESPHPNLRKIKVRHLLSMTSGLHENTYDGLFPQKDWIRAFLAQEFPHEPGFYYRYSTHGSHMLSALVQKAAGESLEEFLNKELFFPLEIREARWEHAPEGLIAGGMGLRLYPASLEKIARLLLNEGSWKGKQLISREYLAHAVFPQAFKQEAAEEKRPFSGNSYGFQFHLGPGGVYRMDGAFGQLCLLAPKQGLGLVALSQNSKTKHLLELAHRHLLSGKSKEKETILENSSLKTRGEKRFSEKSFSCGENPLGIVSVSFSEPGQVTLRYADGSQSGLCYRADHWTEGRSRFVWDLEWGEQPHAVFPLTMEQDRLALEVRYLETPYITRYAFYREGEKTKLRFSQNAGFTLSDFVAELRENNEQLEIRNE